MDFDGYRKFDIDSIESGWVKVGKNIGMSKNNNNIDETR